MVQTPVILSVPEPLSLSMEDGFAIKLWTLGIKLLGLLG